jgi:hypothetical protein
VSNSLRTYFELSIVFVPRKLECLVLIFEFLSRFFVNLSVGVLQVIVVIALIYIMPGSILNMFYANVYKIGVSDFSNRTVRFWQF